LHATYITCSRAGSWAPHDGAAMRGEPNWTFRTLNAGHWPMVSTPRELVTLLDEVAALASRPWRSEDLRRHRGPRRGLVRGDPARGPHRAGLHNPSWECPASTAIWPGHNCGRGARFRQ
jgi:hypothetical protein